MDSSSPETHHPLGNQSYLICLLPLFQIIATYGNMKSSLVMVSESDSGSAYVAERKQNIYLSCSGIISASVIL